MTQQQIRTLDAWLWRTYAIAWGLFLVAGVLVAPEGRLEPAFWLLVIAGALPAINIVRSLLAFPARRSVLGRRRQRQRRRGRALLHANSVEGSIGSIHYETLQWRLLPEGLEVTVPGAGRGFIPLRTVRDIGSVAGGVRIEHWSSEVRSPVVLEGSAELRHALEQALAPGRSERDHERSRRRSQHAA